MKKNYLLMQSFDIVAWDITVNKDEEPVCLEWNIWWPRTVFYQYVNEPLWGDKTDDILSFLKEKDNQKEYIPGFMRI